MLSVADKKTSEVHFVRRVLLGAESVSVEGRLLSRAGTKEFPKQFSLSSACLQNNTQPPDKDISFKEREPSDIILIKRYTIAD